MRMRMGFMLGFGSGYYFGARAGRQRYEQINRTVAQWRRSPQLEAATEKAKAVIDLGVERARETLSHGEGGSAAVESAAVVTRGEGFGNGSGVPPA